MTARVWAVAVLVCIGRPAAAHRLDEYLQGTILSVERNRIQAEISLTPGVAVFPSLMGSMDANKDGVLSEDEQRGYAGQVLRDLSVAIDGHPLTPHLLGARFSGTDAMKEGRGEIWIEFDAKLPAGGPERRLTFENHHQNRIAAYQVNCLVPRDPDIRILGQDRNYSQSLYALRFTQARFRSWVTWFPDTRQWLGTIVLLIGGWLVLLVGFRGKSLNSAGSRNAASRQ